MTKKLLAAFLSAVLLCVLAACTPQSSSSDIGTDNDNTLKTDNVVSKIVRTDDGNTYIEHNGKPYLFYGTQLRIDNIRERYNSDVSLIDQMFAKVKEDGFNTIVIHFQQQNMLPWGRMRRTHVLKELRIMM